MKKNLLNLLLLSFLALSSAFAQSRKITGKVVSADDGLPLPGVTVKVKGGTGGTQTDGDGAFAISATAGQVLTFTYVGFLDQSVTVTSGTLPTIKLVTNTKMLTEVVVQDSYGVSSKKSYAGSATTVAGVQNENKPFSTPIQALQGEVAGLNVSLNSGQPGANIQVRLRGVNSIALSSNPLYVVDGMFINAGDLSTLTTTTNVLAGINENDIESVTVLKDAAATAIYGSRGSNGVIVITTKRGKSGKTAVRFDAEYGLTNVLPQPDAGKPLTGDQYSMLTQEGLLNAGVSPTSPVNGIPYYINLYGLNGPSNNWYSLVNRRGQQQQYNVSLNGGSDATRIFTSLGYFKQEATTIGSSLRRISGLLNLDHTISKSFSINFGLNVSNNNQYTPSNGGAFASPVLASYFLRPFQLAYNPDGSLNSSTIGNTNFPDTYNPLYMVANDSKFDSQTRGLTNATIKWNIWDQLKYTSYTSIDYNITEEQIYNNPIMGDGKSSGGRGYDNIDRYFNLLVRNQLSYRYNIKSVENFYVDASAGYEAQRSQGYFVRAQSNGYPATQPLLTASANAATAITGNSTFSNYTFDSFFATSTVNYKNLYTLSGTFRRDGSSVFGANNRFGNFYAVGGTWNVDEQNFFKKQKIASSLKVRSSIGTTGNASGIGNYQARATASYGANYNGGNGQNFSTVGNADLTWESAQKFDIGADIGFFKDRLTVVFDYYNTNINQLIQNAPISLVTGFSTITENIGSMRNRGEEITIKGIPFQTKDFMWTTNFNIAFNKNMITGLLNHAPIATSVYHYTEGQDIYSYYARAYAGVDPANGNALWYTDGTKTATTSNYNSALRLDGYQADPKYFGGFNNSFTYKGVTLAADFYYNFGNMVRDSWISYLLDGNNYAFNKYQYELNRWTTPGQITDVPKYVAGGIPGNASNSFSTRQLFYGDYIRLKNLTVGYDFKDLAFLKKLGMSKLYVYGRGTNIWTKTYDKKLPFDPEVGVTGQSNLEVPLARTFTIGLNVGL
jgi:TonB-linked SusC/RagA family outer membrane protein